MVKKLSRVVASIFAAAVLLGVPGNAAAETANVAGFEVSAQGNVEHVQVNITKPEGKMTCRAFGVAVGDEWTSPTFASGWVNWFTGNDWSYGFAPVPAGTYDVYWSCTDLNGTFWGADPEYRGASGEPIRVTVLPEGRGNGLGGGSFGGLLSSQ